MNREGKIQKACHELMQRFAPLGCIYLSIPNEGDRSKGQLAQLIAQGLHKGAADYLILWDGNAIFVEFKCPKDTHGPKTYQKPEQKEFERLVATGSKTYYFVIRSQDEFVGTLKAFRLLTQVGGI